MAGARRYEDRYRQDVTIAPDARAAWDDAIDRYFRYDAGVAEGFDDVLGLDPGCATALAVRALLHLEAGEDDRAGVLLDRIDGARRPGSERERSLIATVRAQHADGVWAAEPAWDRHQAAFPGDLLAAEVRSLYAVFTGRDDTLEWFETTGEAARRVVGDVHPALVMVGWAANERGRHDDGGRAAEAALRDSPRALGAAHLMTHVFYEAGEHEVGLEWLTAWSRSLDWSGDFAPHLSWHAGLHELTLGRSDELDARLATDVGRENARLVDGVGTAWRCHLHGVAVAPTSVAAVVERARRVVADPPLTYAGYHALFGLALAGDAAAVEAAGSALRSCRAPGAASMLPVVADALGAYLREEWVVAAEHLRSLEPFRRLGGSGAQFQILEDTLIRSLVRAGEHHEARVRVRARLARRADPFDAATLDELG